MIEVNLLPGGKKKSGKGGKFSFALPKFGGGGSGLSVPKGDRWTLAAGTAAVLALLMAGWLFMGVSGVAEELEVQIEAAASDSSRYAAIIERSTSLQEQANSIGEKVAIIQEIDQKRYVWPHLMDELARALPDYTWITRFSEQVRGERVAFRIEGTTGTYFAMTTFMENLEASPFIEAVTLVSSTQEGVELGGGATQTVYVFTLDAMESIPPPEILETVPLFDPSIVDPSAFESAMSPSVGEG